MRARAAGSGAQWRACMRRAGSLQDGWPLGGGGARSGRAQPPADSRAWAAPRA